MTFDDLISQIKTVGLTQRDRGTYFEYLVRAYLQNDPTYKNEFKNVWLLTDIPVEYGIPKVDIGVDLVAETFTGKLVAVQAKFYEHAIQKSDIDSFLGELGKTYYESGIIITTTDKWGKNAEKALEDRTDVVRIGLSDLRNSIIDWSQFSFDQPENVIIRPPKPQNFIKRMQLSKQLIILKALIVGNLSWLLVQGKPLLV